MDRATLGKVAIVTGGGGGMGLAVALLVAETHHVVLSDVREGPLQAAADLLLADGHPATAIKCDVSDGAAVADSSARLRSEEPSTSSSTRPA